MCQLVSESLCSHLWFKVSASPASWSVQSACLLTNTHTHTHIYMHAHVRTFIFSFTSNIPFPDFPPSYGALTKKCCPVTFAHRSAGYTLLHPRVVCVCVCVCVCASHSLLWVSTRGLHRGQRC